MLNAIHSYVLQRTYMCTPPLNVVPRKNCVQSTNLFILRHLGVPNLVIVSFYDKFLNVRAAY